jgi:hypothetical protein
MAANKTKDTNAQNPAGDPRLRGGTQGGEAARGMDPNLREEGTSGATSPAGGVHVEPPGQAVPRTPLGAAQEPPNRPPEPGRTGATPTVPFPPEEPPPEPGGRGKQGQNVSPTSN